MLIKQARDRAAQMAEVNDLLRQASPDPGCRDEHRRAHQRHRDLDDPDRAGPDRPVPAAHAQRRHASPLPRR